LTNLVMLREAVKVIDSKDKRLWAHLSIRHLETVKVGAIEYIP
jgi:hypothetical protein